MAHQTESDGYCPTCRTVHCTQRATRTLPKPARAQPGLFEVTR